MVVLHLISSLRRGGRERQLAGILKVNNQSYISKAIVFNKTEDSYEKEYELTDKLIYLKSKNPIVRLLDMYKIIKRDKPTIIWTWGGFEASFGLLLSIFTSPKHINGSIRHGIVLRNRKQLWRMLILHLSRYIVANSRAGLKANKLNRGFVLYNGIDNKFNTYKQSLAIDVAETIKQPVRFISVANLVPYKDYFTILISLSNLKKQGHIFDYQIVGDGPMKEELLVFIKEHNLENEITILGRITDVAKHLSRADIFIHSSKGEGCSNAILEAMFAGLPVVASNTGGTPEIVSAENGLLFEYQNAEQLELQIKKLIDDPVLRQDMGRQSAKIAKEKFTEDAMIQNYYQILDRVYQS